MATLQLVTEARKLGLHLRNKPARLYRRICKYVFDLNENGLSTINGVY